MRREVVHRTVYMAVVAHSEEEAFEICDNYQEEDNENVLEKYGRELVEEVKKGKDVQLVLVRLQ